MSSKTGHGRKNSEASRTFDDFDAVDSWDDIVALEDRDLDRDITIKNSELYEMQGQMAEMTEALIRLQSKPLVYATVVKPDGDFDLDAFQIGDHVLILEPKLKKKGYKTGTIAEDLDRKTGICKINTSVYDEKNVPISFNLNVGLNGKPVQFKLVAKNDGKRVVISYQNDQFEVHGLPEKKVNIGDCVKIDVESKQIVDIVGTESSGTICYIKSVIDDKHVEIEVNGATRSVIIGCEQKIEPGSKGVVDRGEVVLLRVLDDTQADEHSVSEKINVSWDSIAGLENVKETFCEAIELPFKHPEIYKFYSQKPPKGILLYGPPGCGKTLCGKAAATTLAKLHGKSSSSTGFVFIKGPELLSKYVGESEAKIRNLFERGKRHFEKNGYPALIFIDEADAVMPARGSGVSSDVEKTIVPMFLSEMDGLETSHCIVILATNKPESLDPAITREGRIDRHIKINRPTAENAAAYFQINLKNIPIDRATKADELIEFIIQHLFAPEKVMYEIKEDGKSEYFCLSDCVNGAMITTLCQSAVQKAIQRDLKTGKRSGVNAQDFHTVIDGLYEQHLNVNHEFDIQDFLESNDFTKKASVTPITKSLRKSLNKVK